MQQSESHTRPPHTTAVRDSIRNHFCPERVCCAQASRRSRSCMSKNKCRGSYRLFVISAIGSLTFLGAPTAAIPIENPYCSCKLTRVRLAGGPRRPAHLGRRAREGGVGREVSGGDALCLCLWLCRLCCLCVSPLHSSWLRQRLSVRTCRPLRGRALAAGRPAAAAGARMRRTAGEDR